MGTHLTHLREERLSRYRAQLVGPYYCVTSNFLSATRAVTLEVPSKTLFAKASGLSANLIVLRGLVRGGQCVGNSGGPVERVLMPYGC